VADSANKISVYRELATNNVDALSRIIVNTDASEAQKLLGAVGLRGMYEGYRSRGEILVEADNLNLRLTKEQIENLVANRQALMAELGPKINLLVAQKKLTEAQADSLLKTLPLELTRLQLQIEKDKIDIAKGEKELARFEKLLDATIARIQQQTNVLVEEANYLREQIRTEILRQSQVEAQTQLTKAQAEATKADAELTKEQTELTAEQIKGLAQTQNIQLAESGTTMLRNIANLVISTGTTDLETIKVLLRDYKNIYKPPDDFIDSLAKIMASGASEAKNAQEIQKAGAIAELASKAVNIAMVAPNPEAARKLAEEWLGESVDPKRRKLVGDMAAYLKTINLGNDLPKIVEPYMKMPPPPPGAESGLLGKLYDSIPDKRFANSIVNTIKAQWALMRATQNLEKEGKKVEIDKEKAFTALYKIQATLAPKQFGLEEKKLAFEQEQFDFQKWYQREQIKLGWARLELEKLLAQAENAGTGKDSVETLKDLVSAAKGLDTVAINQLDIALRESGHTDCANSLGKDGTINWIEEVRKTSDKCNDAVREVLTNREKYGNVINAVENAVRFGQVVTEIANQLIGGGPAQPTGGVQPGGGTPSGMTGPQPQGGATGLPTGGSGGFGGKAARLRTFGVSVPKDPKIAGAMAFIHALEGGSEGNPFEIRSKSGAKPKGPDKGFSAVIAADPSRPVAINIDSAPVFGLTWILPVMATNPGMTEEDVKKIKPEYVSENDGLFKRARYFTNRSGVVDSAAVAASYATGALIEAGVQVKYTPLFTSLMRTIAESDLRELNAGLKTKRVTPGPEAEQRFLTLVMSRYGSRYRELGLGSQEELRSVARQLYQATRLSTIGQDALGGEK